MSWRPWPICESEPVRPADQATGTAATLYLAAGSEKPTGRLSGQWILAPYKRAPLNPRPDLPAPARRRETTPIRGPRPILTPPRAYCSKARRALIFDSLHPPADAAPGAVRPTRPR